MTASSPPTTHAVSFPSSRLPVNLLRAAREVRLLAAVTPVNMVAERRRLAKELERGRPALPRYEFAASSRTELRRTLAALWREAAAFPRAWAALYRARIEELDLEARIAESAGTPRLGELSHARFAEEDDATRAEAMERTTDWLRLAAATEGPEVKRVASDSIDPSSLLSAMRRAVGAAKLPFTVEVSEALASRAATGERTIWVAAGRRLTEGETRRTVAHEIDGHARPRARAQAAARPAIFAIGTARGTDDQEGYALVVEERSGLFDDARRKELAARHWTVDAMSGGATFADVTRALVSESALTPEAALLIAERAFRGSHGVLPGLGRERVYLGAWIRVRAHLARAPQEEAVLASGQIALRALPALGAPGS